jgi:uncharacterized protein (DUF4415 family)
MKHSKTNWKKVDALKDDEIDFSDSPELDESFFKTAAIIMPKNKQVVTLRLDHEIVEFFKSNYDHYQTKINAVLATYTKHAKKSEL